LTPLLRGRKLVGYGPLFCFSRAQGRGAFVADSGRSIFLEQNFLQRGQQRHFRWEIPYQYIVRLEEKTEDEENGDAGRAKASALSTERNDQVSRAAASASAGVPGLLPLPHRPKPA
jgi:hypothetical protein